MHFIQIHDLAHNVGRCGCARELVGEVERAVKSAPADGGGGRADEGVNQAVSVGVPREERYRQLP